MAKDQIQMPSSGGGLVRYFDDIKSKITFSPVTLTVIIVLVIVIEILLYKGVF